MTTSLWTWTILAIAALFVLAGSLYIANTPAMVPAPPATNNAASSTSPNAASGSPISTANPRAAATSPLIVISSPANGDSYCTGDIIPIRWSAPKTAQSFSLKVAWQTGSSIITSVAGNSTQFSSPVYYDYTWDQKNSSGGAFFAGAGYYVEVSARMEDGSTAVGRSGTFSITACTKNTL